MTNSSYKGDVCKASHSFALDNFIRKFFQNPKIIVGPHIKSGDTVIDLGCGPGFFTIDMARMTGPEGRVIAVDLQEEMLNKLHSKTRDNNISDRIMLHNCSQDAIGLDPEIKADFILAFYMVHETPDQDRFLREIRPHLKDNGHFLIVEPLFHVSRKKFEETAQRAETAGYKIADRPKKKGGRSLLLTT